MSKTKIPSKKSSLVILERSFPDVEEKDLKKLLKLKIGDRDQESMFKSDVRWFLLDVIGMIHTLGFDETFEYLQEAGKGDHSRRYILDHSPLTRKIREKEFIEKTLNLREKPKIKSVYKCPKCKTDNVDTSNKQIRKGDEAETDFNTCRNPACQYKWRIN